MAYAKEFMELLAMHFGNYNLDSNIGKILRSIEVSDNEFIQATEDLKEILDIDNSYGANLKDIHGANKGLKRLGLTDEEYKQRLKLETKVNNSDGDVETLEEAAKVLFGEEDFRGITEVDNATIQIDLLLKDKVIPNDTFERAVAAAVGVVYATTDEEQVIQIVMEKATFRSVVYLACGTAYTGQELGVIL